MTGKTTRLSAAHLALILLVSVISHGPLARVLAADEPVREQKDDPLAGSAISAVIEANGGKLPRTGAELQHAFAKVSDVVQLPVPFSAVALNSGLMSPRVILTTRAGPLGTATVNRPNLAGRLFFAVNMEYTGVGDPRARSAEFISWNVRRRQFDFGVIEDLGGEPRLKVLDGMRCLTCHKNRGPILGRAPWSNTTHNDIVRRASETLFLPPGAPDRAGLREVMDGMTLFKSQVAEVDAAVRGGADLAVNREIYRLLNRDPAGREVFLTLLGGIVTPGPIEKIDRDLKVRVNRAFGNSFARFAADWLALQKATKSSVLLDFNPAGSVGNGTGAWSGSSSAVTRYDLARLGGDHGLPARAQPSNPRAFARPPLKALAQPSNAVSATRLAATIGLSEGDRRFLAQLLADASKRIGKPGVTPAGLARHVFDGPRFQDLLAGGELPEREDFKERFVEGLSGVLKARHEVLDGLTLQRKGYASGPRYEPLPAGARPEVALVPTTACLRCHDVRGSGRARFVETIPALAFDPFDKAGREVWLKTAERKRKLEVLGRMLQRLGEDRDMPPEDAPEYELFRARDAASFDEVKRFLEVALKKARAN